MTSVPSFCTIVSKNYLAHARVLAESVRAQHPDAKVFVLLADRDSGQAARSNEPFEFVPLEALSIPHGDEMRFYYSVLEFDTAVKPFLFRYLCERGSERLIYLDPDTWLVGPMDHVIEALDSHELVVTPHITAPLNDGRRPSDLDILNAGSFNLGFLGLRSSPATLDFLRWWSERLVEGCFLDVQHGLHVDQKWVDLAPLFVEGTHVLRHPGYNVAYWNLHERQVTSSPSGWHANGEPLVFYHFSGLEIDDLERVSRHQNRWTLTRAGDAVRALFLAYRAALEAAGYRAVAGLPYGFATFSNGVEIAPFVRRLYFREGPSRERFGDPFDVDHAHSFWSWLREPVTVEDGARLPRLLAELRSLDRSVGRQFGYLAGSGAENYMRWARRQARTTHGIDPRLVPLLRSSRLSAASRLRPRSLALRDHVDRAKPVLLGTIGRNRRLWDALKRVYNFLVPPS